MFFYTLVMVRVLRMKEGFLLLTLPSCICADVAELLSGEAHLQSLLDSLQ